jgi:hypothetical protein
MALQPRRLISTSSPPWEPQISYIVCGKNPLKWIRYFFILLCVFSPQFVWFSWYCDSLRHWPVFYSRQRHRLQTGPIHPTSQCVPDGVISAGLKRPGRDTNYSSSSVSKLKNEWSYTFTPLYVFWCLIKHKDSIKYKLSMSLFHNINVKRSVFLVRDEIKLNVKIGIILH